jgi:hypothetical protein
VIDLHLPHAASLEDHEVERWTLARRPEQVCVERVIASVEDRRP